jgi:hypothetical protein
MSSRSLLNMVGLAVCWMPRRLGRAARSGGMRGGFVDMRNRDLLITSA